MELWRYRDTLKSENVSDLSSAYRLLIEHKGPKERLPSVPFRGTDALGKETEYKDNVKKATFVSDGKFDQYQLDLTIKRGETKFLKAVDWMVLGGNGLPDINNFPKDSKLFLRKNKNDEESIGEKSETAEERKSEVEEGKTKSRKQETAVHKSTQSKPEKATEKPTLSEAKEAVNALYCPSCGKLMRLEDADEECPPLWECSNQNCGATFVSSDRNCPECDRPFSRRLANYACEDCEVEMEETTAFECNNKNCRQDGLHLDKEEAKGCGKPNKMQNGYFDQNDKRMRLSGSHP
jgi:hypothetical protein